MKLPVITNPTRQKRAPVVRPSVDTGNSLRIAWKNIKYLILTGLLLAGTGVLSYVKAQPAQDVFLDIVPDVSTSDTPAAINSSSDIGPNPPLYKIVINIPSRTLWVYSGNHIIKYYPVGVGRIGYMTPLGHYAITQKVLDPGWENPYLPQGRMRMAPGRENPLGTRWMGFYQDQGGEYGMHGTDTPSSVGKFSSHGCVRMKIPDAEALFNMVDIGTPVDVVYKPVLIRQSQDIIRVIVYPDRFHRGMPTRSDIKNQILSQYPTAQIDVVKLQNALSQANERPVDVGLVPINTISDSPKF